MLTPASHQRDRSAPPSVGEGSTPSAANGATFFSQEEFEDRIARVRAALVEEGLDAAVITTAENVYYLTGLNHQGYFAYTSLILPVDKTPVLIIRAMEKVIVNDMVVPDVDCYYYSDGVEPLPAPKDREQDLTISAPIESAETYGLRATSMSLGVSVHTGEKDLPDFSAPVKATCRALNDLGLSEAIIGLGMDSSFLPYKVASAIVKHMPHVEWRDLGSLVNDRRIIQSPAELQCSRKAAEISDAMVLAGAAMAGSGVRNQDVAASVYHTMIQRGGTFPAFVPLIRSTHTLGHEHGTWDDRVLEDNDMLFLEMSGCYWRYHAPVGRLVYIKEADDSARRVYDACLDAHYSTANAIKPGVTADSVYSVWKKTIDAAGLDHYHRHHCGYLVGIGFPPSWSGSGVPRSLRRGSDMELKSGMVFHLMSWLLRTGQGDAFMSDTVLVTDDGCEFLTRAPRELLVR